MLAIALGASINVNSAAWVHPSGKDVRTVYYQGINASQTQVSKYTGSRGFTATTGEHVVCKCAFDVIEYPFIGKELDEVQLKRVYTKKRSYIKNFFRHPIRVLEQCFNSVCENTMFGITIENPNLELKESLVAHNVHVSCMSLGQGHDIAEHQARYDLCVQQFPDSDIILYGVSRGAATTFNSCACNHYDINKIKLIVLEACFDSVSSVLHNSPFFGGRNKLEKAFMKALSSHTQFKDEGLAPIKLVNDFPEGVPVLFVTSTYDKIVPMASVLRLVAALKTRGKNPIYVLTLEHSSHPKYMMSNKQDTENYRDCIHALYKSLDLPYIPEYAQSGDAKQILKQCLVQG